MNQVIGFYIITTAINFIVWVLSLFENTLKEAMINAFVLQMFITLIFVGSYLIVNGV